MEQVKVDVPRPKSIMPDAQVRSLTAQQLADLVAYLGRSNSYPKGVVLLTGTGIVGGKLASGFEHGKTAGSVAARILNGENPADIPVTEDGTHAFMFDWKQLKRHHLPEDLLPPGSTVIDKQPSAWELYKWWIIIALSVLVTESLLIMLLLVHIAMS